MTTQPPLIQEPSIFLTVWDEAWAAITKPRMYVKWALQPLSRSFAYASILFAIMALVTTAYLTVTVRPQWLTAKTWIAENVPAFSLKDGQLSIQDDKTFSYSDNTDIFVRIDTSDELKDVAIDPFYQYGMVITRDGALIRTASDQTEPVSFAQAGIEDFSTDGAQLAEGLNSVFTQLLIGMPILVFLGLFLSKGIFTGLFAFMIALVSGFKLPVRAVWSMALYALTPSLLASYIMFIIYPLPIVSSLVFVTYMILAVMNYRRFLDLKQQLS